MARRIARKLPAILLIVCWIALSRIDLLEDLGFPNGNELSASAVISLDAGQTVRRNHNLIELAVHLRPNAANPPAQAAQRRRQGPAAPAERTYPRHKLHHVFLL